MAVVGLPAQQMIVHQEMTKTVVQKEQARKSVLIVVFGELVLSLRPGENVLPRQMFLVQFVSMQNVIQEQAHGSVSQILQGLIVVIVDNVMGEVLVAIFALEMKYAYQTIA